ncbi:MAG: DUF4403 family protein [Alphaproteobacteria bacterium]|nr:DUF4403 family protein [Alphaproteobacteria bacterium]
MGKIRPTLTPHTVLIAGTVLLSSFLITFATVSWLAGERPQTDSDSTTAAQVQTVPPPAPAVAPTAATLITPSPVAHGSIVVAPVTISLASIQDVIEQQAGHKFTGKVGNRSNNLIEQFLHKSDIAWTLTRGPMAVSGNNNVLSLSSSFNGKVNASGTLSPKVATTLTAVLGNDAAKRAVPSNNLNATADINGRITISSSPKLAAAWHLEPNFTAQLTLKGGNLALGGTRINLPTQVKPLIENTLNEQLNLAGDRIRNDPTLRETARAQWSKACRSIPLQASSELPPLWLELKPVRAIASQPQIDASTLTLFLGLEAETRITATETMPECKFPDTISIGPPGGTGVSISMPIDVSFSEINRILQTHLVGQTFPKDGTGKVKVTINAASVTPAYPWLITSLTIRAIEKRGLFGSGIHATLNIRGRPVLDQAQQTLRLTDIQLTGEPDALERLSPVAAQMVTTYLQQTLAQQAVLDLKPFAASAKESITHTIATYRRNDGDLRVDASIDSLVLSDIAFDDKILRVTVDAGANLAVTIGKARGS